MQTEPANRKVLCVCTRDTSRAPMISFVLSQYLATCGMNDVEIKSAGVRPNCGGQPANEMATECMVMEGEKYGDFMRNHESTFIDDLVLGNYDFFIVADRKVRKELLEMRPAINLETIHVIGGSKGIMDPFGLGARAYQVCLVQIKTAMPAIADFVSRGILDVAVSAELVHV